MAYPIGYAVTASITITAGAHRSQPSRRSSRAPSDGRARRRRPGARGSRAVTGGVVVVMSLPLCTNARCSWRQPFALQGVVDSGVQRSEEHTSELQSRRDLVCRLLLEKKKKKTIKNIINNKINRNIKMN